MINLTNWKKIISELNLKLKPEKEISDDSRIKNILRNTVDLYISRLRTKIRVVSLVSIPSYFIAKNEAICFRREYLLLFLPVEYMNLCPFYIVFTGVSAVESCAGFRQFAAGGQKPARQNQQQLEHQGI